MATALFLLVSMAGLAGASPYGNFNFDDIDFWVGEGSNQAALVIDWNDDKNPQSIAWGYRWDGEASGEDMLKAVAGSGLLRFRDGGDTLGTWSDGADSKLYARFTEWNNGMGRTVLGLGYDINGNGSGFVSGYENSEDGHATDSADHYFEGWFTGYWSYWVSDGNKDWGYSGLGMTGRKLTDGSWDGWSALPGFSGGSPDQPISATAGSPVPVPAAIWLLGSGLVGLMGARKRAIR